MPIGILGFALYSLNLLPPTYYNYSNSTEVSKHDSKYNVDRKPLNHLWLDHKIAYHILVDELMRHWSHDNDLIVCFIVYVLYIGAPHPSRIQ